MEGGGEVGGGEMGGGGGTDLEEGLTADLDLEGVLGVDLGVGLEEGSRGLRG